VTAVVIRGAKNGDVLGTFDQATGIVEDRQGRRRDGIADLDAAHDVMRDWSWEVEPTPAGRVLDAAIAIARAAPARRGQYVSHAKIYWPRIEELRAALDALGIDWRPA
jgi:hypothetical protein